MDIPLKAMIQTQKTEKVMIFFKTRNTSWSARISLTIPGSSTRCRTGYDNRDLSEVIIKEAVQEKGKYINALLPRREGEQNRHKIQNDQISQILQ